MNEFQSKRVQSIEKAFPGCLGRMVNLFDLSNGFARNRLLTDKPHRDAGSSLARSQSNGDQIEDKMIVSELRRSNSNKKASGTPMKTLIAQEMSNEVEDKHHSTNVVAKLMGLDVLPQQQPHSVSQRTYSVSLSSGRFISHSGTSSECWEDEHNFLDKHIHFEGHRCQQQDQYKDVYEIWQKSQKITTGNNQTQEERCNERINEKKMALVRKKFMEAKRLSTIEKGSQTKEFHDALEFLSSNRDALLKFLQESNSKFSQHLYDMKTTPPLETKRITVLRPSKVVSDDKVEEVVKKNGKQMNKPCQLVQAIEWDNNKSGYSPPCNDQRLDEFPGQPTRIVVLKPSSIKACDASNEVSPHSSSTKVLREDFGVAFELDGARNSREVAIGITSQACETPMDHRRDETLLSSVFSNGYIGDDSSFNKSEIEYAGGNLSDSEIMSPTSRHSWEFVNRFGSLYSSSFFSRASYSPESSVCREAKKRLSERFAMMTSNGCPQGQAKAQKSSSTLGEMLALLDTKKSTVSSEEDAAKIDQVPRASVPCSPTNLDKEVSSVSPKNLTRSKSVPESSTLYDARLNIEPSDLEPGKGEVSGELTKTKSTKSSLRGKVSSLFFLRNKKPGIKRSEASSSKDESHTITHKTSDSPTPSTQNVAEAASRRCNNSDLDEFFSPSLCGSSGKITNQDLDDIVANEEGLSVAKPLFANATVCENQEQPSPISVLELPFVEDDNTIAETSDDAKPDGRGAEVSCKSSLIDKSPPIGSVARTLSWDDSCEERATSYAYKHPSVSSASEEEQDWRAFIQTLLSAGGFTGEMQPEFSLSRWHSLDCPLDPSLKDKYANLNNNDLLYEAKRRQRRSNRKLMFDYVNAALVEMTGYGPDMSTRAVTSCCGTDKRITESLSPSILVDQVWDQIKNWFFSEMKCTSGDSGDGNSLAVEGVMRKEVMGRWWIDNVRVEVDNFGMEIEGKLLEELVEEAVLDLTSRSC